MLKGIYHRLNLDHLATADQYMASLEQSGLSKVDMYFETQNMMRHYGAVKHAALTYKNAELLGEKGVSQAFLDRAIPGLTNWVNALKANDVQWGWFVYKK